MLSSNSTEIGASTPISAQVLKSLPLSSSSDSISPVAYLALPLAHYFNVLFISGTWGFQFLVLELCYRFQMFLLYFIKHLSVLGMMGAFHINLVHHSDKSNVSILNPKKQWSDNLSIKVLQLFALVFLTRPCSFVVSQHCPVGWHLEINGRHWETKVLVLALLLANCKLGEIT